MKQNKQQWKKRVDIFRLIYTDLMSNFTSTQMKTEAFEKLEFDIEQMKIVDYYCLNKKKMISLLTKHLSKQWEWDRISFVDKSILLTAVSEFNTNKIDKKIIIDQALINAKFYSDVASIKFINAILDKVLI